MIFMMESEMVGQELSQLNQMSAGGTKRLSFWDEFWAHERRLLKSRQLCKTSTMIGIALEQAHKQWGDYEGEFPMLSSASEVGGRQSLQNPALPNHEDLPMPPVNEDFSECFMTSWLEHQAEEAAKPAPLAAYPGAWPPPKMRFPGL